MKVNRKIIEIDKELCDGCGLCIPSCAEGALEIIDGKAEVIKDMYCDGLGACLGECPNNALKIIEREADEFDEKAVEKFLDGKKKIEQEIPKEPSMPCGCPSTQIQNFGSGNCQSANKPQVTSGSGSSLMHWPVQIRLIPPNAPFLKNADLLIIADCVPIAYPDVHENLMKNKVVMMGCPKFDDAESYIEKFTEIFKVADIKSVTIPYMEVPCCSGLPIIVKKAMELSGNNIPLKLIEISRTGEIVSEN